ncbi:hypothetical protein VSR34_33690 [Paraburkholderia sp. JHI2823]|uniref:hypothetical protein n=1 Tax=Paraburkholderia sp. JHI2823 TaxID=3112960 RepID=UPI003179EE1B
MIDLATRRRGLARGIVTELQYDPRVLSQRGKHSSTVSARPTYAADILPMCAATLKRERSTMLRRKPTDGSLPQTGNTTGHALHRAAAYLVDARRINSIANWAQRSCDQGRRIGLCVRACITFVKGYRVNRCTHAEYDELQAATFSATILYLASRPKRLAQIPLKASSTNFSLRPADR